jgi:hypothetical protein
MSVLARGGPGLPRRNLRVDRYGLAVYNCIAMHNSTTRPRATSRANRLFRFVRWVFTGAAVTTTGLAIASFWAYSVGFGTPAYHIYDSRLIVHFPLEWAQNEYSHDRPFPIDTDSLFGVVTYWIPNLRECDVWWISHSARDARSWLRYWLHPLDTSTDGEFAETGARALPLSCLVYCTTLPCLLMWRPWRRRRRGHCPCGYDLSGLDRSARCPECGTTLARSTTPLGSRPGLS